MDTTRRPGRPPTDGADEPDAWRPSLGYLAVAVGTVAGGLAFWLTASPSPKPEVAGIVPSATPTGVASASAPSAPGLVAASSGPAPSTPVRAAAAASGLALAAATGGMATPAREEDGDTTPDLSLYVNPGETPTMAEVIERLHQAGIHGGLGAFSPPGTSPPLAGLAVPEDYALPEGYVRHYQATDDGQRIEPILMFSPDYQFLDAARRPIAIPEDRVVPTELAPPGLPIRHVVIPAPAEPGRPGR